MSVVFPYLIALYLLDCVVYRSGCRLIFFISQFGEAFALRISRLSVAGLLPIGRMFLSENLPVLLTGAGVYTLPAEYQNEPLSSLDNRFINFADISEIKVAGKCLTVNQHVVAQSASAKKLTELLNLILELKGLPSSERKTKLQLYLAKATDSLKLRRRYEEASAFLGYLEMLSGLLFIQTFIVLPLGLYLPSFEWLNIKYVCLCMASIYCGILLLTYFGHKKIHRGTAAGSLVFVSVHLVLAPYSALHAGMKVMENLFESFDYLAIASVLLPSGSFRQLARREMLWLWHAKRQDQPKDVVEALALRENAVRRLVAEAGEKIDDILAPRATDDAAAAGFCPMCSYEYQDGVAFCSDCGFPLEKFYK